MNMEHWWNDTDRRKQKHPKHGRIQVLWVLKLMPFWGSCLWKRIKNYEYKIWYGSVPPRALQEVRAYEGTW